MCLLTRLSPSQVKINDRGIAALAYNVLLREGVTLGLGGSFDTQKLDQATHKVNQTTFISGTPWEFGLTWLSSVPASPSRVKHLTRLRKTAQPCSFWLERLDSAVFCILLHSWLAVDRWM